MAMNLSPLEVLKGWGEALNTPLGRFLLIIVFIYIGWTIYNGSSPFEMLRGGKGKGGRGQERKVNYIIKH